MGSWCRLHSGGNTHEHISAHTANTHNGNSGTAGGQFRRRGRSEEFWGLIDDDATAVVVDHPDVGGQIGGGSGLSESVFLPKTRLRGAEHAEVVFTLRGGVWV